MKSLSPLALALTLALAGASAVFAADALPVFNGVMTLGAESRFVLINPDGAASPWIKLGDSFAGYALKTYDAKDSSLELVKDGKSIKVLLDAGRGTQSGTVAAATAGALNAANNLMQVMRFEELITKTMDQQRKAMGPMMQQMMTQMGAGANMSPEDRAEFLAFQQKIADDLMGSVMGPELKNDMAKVYSETFTEAELSAQAAFYSTPVGQAVVDKTPEIQTRLNALISPRIMQNMGKVQQSVREFAQKRADRQAAKAAEAK